MSQQGHFKWPIQPPNQSQETSQDAQIQQTQQNTQYHASRLYNWPVLVAMIVTYLFALILVGIGGGDQSNTQEPVLFTILTSIGTILILLLNGCIIVLDGHNFFTLYGHIKWKRLKGWPRVGLILLYLGFCIMPAIYLVMAIKHFLELRYQTVPTTNQSVQSQPQVHTLTNFHYAVPPHTLQQNPPLPSVPTSITPLHEEKKAITIFFCYAHEDESLLNGLKAHLQPLQRQGFIKTWYDRDIMAGTEWEQAIVAQLNTAEVILLLVSPSFLASDYCYSKEMQRAIERHEQGAVRAIPIILRPCDWTVTPLGKLQALPKDGKPVTNWANRDNAYLDVALGIRRAIAELTSKPF